MSSHPQAVFLRLANKFLFLRKLHVVNAVIPGPCLPLNVKWGLVIKWGDLANVGPIIGSNLAKVGPIFMKKIGSSDIHLCDQSQCHCLV